MLLLTPLVLPMPEARAEETKTSTRTPAQEEAIQHAKVAAGLYKEGKFVEALVAFKKAYELSPRPALTYNIARCYEQLSQWSEAIQEYERFVTETTDPREKSEALDRVKFLRSKIAPDDNSPEAKYRATLDEGKKAFARGDFEGAIEQFKGAFAIKPSAGLLYNIAKSYEKLGRYEEAIDSFTQYLDLDKNASDRPDVEETIRRLQKSIRERFQELSVSSNPPGADIYLDDRNTGLQGQTNFRFKVKPGPHTLYLDLNGYEAVKRDFVMPDDKPLALDFELQKLKNVGYIEIAVNVDGARIFVDGAIMGLSPFKQKKALSEGVHQITVEAIGYPRWNQEFTIARDKTENINVELVKVDPGVADDTLGNWGRNLIVLGLVGGGLGFIGPFAYQKLILRREVPEYIGPTRVAWGPNVAAGDTIYWRGSPKDASGNIKSEFVETDLNDAFRENTTATTLSQIQLWSAVAGGVLAAGGLGLYIYKWARPEEKTAVVLGQADEPEEPEPVEITSFGAVPTGDGAAVGLSGRF